MNHALKEVPRGDHPLSFRRPKNEFRVEREHDRSPVALRVRVGQRATEGAQISHQWIRNPLTGDGDRGVVAPQKRRVGQLAVAGQRTKDQVTVTLLDGVEPRYRVDVDEHRRLRETKLQDRDEALAARQKLRFVTVLLQQRQSRFDGRRTFVVELGRVHWRSDFACAQKMPCTVLLISSARSAAIAERTWWRDALASHDQRTGGSNTTAPPSLTR